MGEKGLPHIMARGNADVPLASTLAGLSPKA